MASLTNFGIAYRVKRGATTPTFTNGSATFTCSATDTSAGFATGSMCFIRITDTYGLYAAKYCTVSGTSVTMSSAFSGTTTTYTWYFSVGVYTATNGSAHLGERLSWINEVSCSLDTTPMPESLPSQTLVYDVEGYTEKVTIEGFWLNTSDNTDIGYQYYIKSYACDGTNYDNYPTFVWWEGETAGGGPKAYPVVIESMRTSNALADKVAGNNFITRYTLTCVVRDDTPY